MRQLILGVALAALVACEQKNVVEPSKVVASDGFSWQASYASSLAQAKSEKKLVMVDLYTDWCGWCRRLDKDVYANPAVAAKLASTFVAVKLNPEKSKEAAEVAKKFGTRGFPHIVFVDGSGNKVDEISGYLPATDFLKRLNALPAGK